jgi:hypothetical protein
MTKDCLTWLLILSITNLWVYFRVLNLYEKIRHTYFLIDVCELRLNKLEEKETDSDVNEKCEDCQRYCDDCDGMGEE